MRRALTALLVLTVTAAPALAKRRAVQPRGPLSSTPYLDAARQAANWLAAVERPAGDGLAWPWSDRNAYAPTGLSNGAAGIGLFHLRLYQVTREPQYLEKARGAAAYVAAEYGRGREGGFDWQSSAVGGGEFFVLMYRETGEARYRDAAVLTGEILLRLARRDGSGIHWQFPNTANVYTGISHGTAGAGLFFLHLHDIAGNGQYVDIARDAYQWLAQHDVPIGADGIGWKRLTRDSAAYHGFCGGSSGIIHFLDELVRVTGDAAYRTAFVRTANGLANAADRIAPDQVGWRYTTESTGNRPVIYCHGTSCATTAMLQAWTVTGDHRYRDLARAAMRHVESLATTHEGDGPVWPHIERSSLIEHGFQTGAASVGYTYLRMHAAFGDRHYLDRAGEIGDFLIRAADRPAPGQMRWINFRQIPPGATNTVAYETGWYMGSAGIGLFFLDLHERLMGRVPEYRFSPVSP